MRLAIEESSCRAVELLGDWSWGWDCKRVQRERKYGRRGSKATGDEEMKKSGVPGRGRALKLSGVSKAVGRGERNTVKRGTGEHRYVGKFVRMEFEFNS